MYATDAQHGVPAKRASPASAKDNLIAALKGGVPLTEFEQRVVDAIAAGYGLEESDPFWILLLPPLLKGSDGEIKELLQQALQRSGSTSAEDLEDVDRIADLNASLLKLTQSIDKRVERGVTSAFLAADFPPSAAPVAPAPVDVVQIRNAVTKAVEDGISQLRIFRIGLAAAVLVSTAAVSFLAGVSVDKGAYEKHIATLEAKVAAFESVAKRGGG